MTDKERAEILAQILAVWTTSMPTNEVNASYTRRIMDELLVILGVPATTK